MEKLHPKAVWLFFISYLGRAIPLLFAFSYFGYGLIYFLIVRKTLEQITGKSQGGASMPSWGIVAIVVLAISAYIIFCFIWAKLSYRFWQYELTDTALKVEKGVIWKKYISIPYERIQNVDIFRGLLARILGLSDLQVQTAGYSGGYHPRGRIGFSSEGRLPGLAPQVAERLREELIQKARGVRHSQGMNQGL